MSFTNSPLSDSDDNTSSSPANVLTTIYKYPGPPLGLLTRCSAHIVTRT